MALAFGSELNGVESKSRLGRITLLLFLLAVALLGLVVLRAYQARTTEVAVHEVPVLQADTSPTRERPDDPGGLRVPNADAAVFQTLEGGPAEPVVERLLPPPESPMPKPLSIVASEAPLPLTPPVPATSAGSDSAAPSSNLVSDAAPDASAPLSSPNDPDRPVEPAMDLALGPQMPALADPQTGYRVQLGAFRQPGEAEKGWSGALAAAPDLLGPVSHFVIQTDLGADKGVFHRLQAGPFPSRDSAESLCNQLKAKSVDCYVVSP